MRFNSFVAPDVAAPHAQHIYIYSQARHMCSLRAQRIWACYTCVFVTFMAEAGVTCRPRDTTNTHTHTRSYYKVSVYVCVCRTGCTLCVCARVAFVTSRNKLTLKVYRAPFPRGRHINEIKLWHTDRRARSSNISDTTYMPHTERHKHSSNTVHSFTAYLIIRRAALTRRFV